MEANAAEEGNVLKPVYGCTPHRPHDGLEGEKAEQQGGSTKGEPRRWRFQLANASTNSPVLSMMRRSACLTKGAGCRKK